MDPLLERLFGLERFETIVDSEDAPDRKPDPSAHRLAARAPRGSPSVAPAVEDSDNGLKVAKAAGLACVIVVNGYSREQDLGDADLVLDGFGDGELPATVLADPPSLEPPRRLDVDTLRRLVAAGKRLPSRAMAAPYTLKNLTELDDSAPKFGYGELQEARFANEALEAERTGLSYHRVRPGKRQGFAHRHDEAEEVYVVVRGSGRVKLDEDIVELSALDALRVAPGVTRQFEAGPDGLELVVAGPRHEGDGEILPGWWSE